MATGIWLRPSLLTLTLIRLLSNNRLLFRVVEPDIEGIDRVDWQFLSSEEYNPFDSTMRSLLVAVYELGVNETVDLISRHPLMVSDVNVAGYIMDSETGLLTKID